MTVVNVMDDGGERRVCVDGKQRLTSIYRCATKHVFGELRMLTSRPCFLKVHRWRSKSLSLPGECGVDLAALDRFLVSSALSNT